MKLIVLECKGCGGFFPPKQEQVLEMADFFAGYGWQYAGCANLSGATIVAFYGALREYPPTVTVIEAGPFKNALLGFSSMIERVYKEIPEDSGAQGLHLAFGDNLKIVAETQIAKPEETGSFLAAYLMQRR